MKKCDERAHERSCWNKAREDEILFIMMERDLAAPETIRFWVEKRIELGLNKRDDPQMQDALACANRMEGRDNG